MQGIIREYEYPLIPQKQKPKIIGETKREIEEKKPPVCLKSGRAYPLYFSRASYESMLKHCRSSEMEVLGYLLGYARSWEGKLYSLIESIATGSLEQSATHVRFRNLDELARALEEHKSRDYLLLGWYHSHPDMSCFLSDTDVVTQQKMFRKPHQVAVVVDPKQDDARAYKLTSLGIQKPYAQPAVIKDYYIRLLFKII